MRLEEKLKKLRTENNFSQEQLAEVLHVSRQAVTKWEAGTSVPDIETLKIIALLFDVSVDYLVNEEEYTSSNSSICFKTACVFSLIGFAIGFIVEGMNIAFSGLIAAIFGYCVSYIILLIQKRI